MGRFSHLSERTGRLVPIFFTPVQEALHQHGEGFLHSIPDPNQRMGRLQSVGGALGGEKRQ